MFIDIRSIVEGGGRSCPNQPLLPKGLAQKKNSTIKYNSFEMMKRVYVNTTFRLYG